MIRDSIINLRLTEADKRAIEAKAAKAGLSASDFIRREVGLRVNRKPQPVALQQPGDAALTRLGLKDADSDQTQTG